MHFRTLITATLTFLVFLAPLGVNAACGSVTNKSDRTLKFTKDPSPNLKAHAGRCQFWNWYDGDGPLSLVPRSKLVSCSQHDLGGGGKKAGACVSGTNGGDVDGFTFPNNAYWIGVKRIGGGVWTKFPDPVDFVCRRTSILKRIDCTWSV